MATNNINQFIFDLSAQLLKGDMLTNTLFKSGQVGKDLRSLVAKEGGALKLTDPMAEALTGRIRSDAGMLRQASKNVSEAKSVTDMAESSVQTIREALERMQEIAEGVADGSLAIGASDAEYNSLVTQIQGTINSASYNGINLLTSTNWAGDERVTVEGTAGSPDAYGTINIQAGTDSFKLSLNDLKFLADGNFTGSLSSLSGLTLAAVTDLDSTSNASDTANELSTLVTYIKTIETNYEGRSSSLNSQSSALTSQASILDTAAETREQTNDSKSLEELLLDYIVKQVGGVVNKSS